MNNNNFLQGLIALPALALCAISSLFVLIETNSLNNLLKQVTS
jgi:hypothetical protein